MILDLNNPEKSEIKYDYLLLPDGQPHIRIYDFRIKRPITIKCSLTSMNDIGKLIVAKNALDNLDKYVSDLKIAYMLGARQDKRVFGEALTLKCMAKIINDHIRVGQVSVLHPHSQATINLIDRAKELDHTQYVEQAIEDFNPDFLIIPDLGAAKNAQRYEKFDLPQVQCYKQRDPKTGKLSGFGVYSQISDGRGLIVDDICDAGGTFLGLSKLFPKNDLALYVTHGIFSKRETAKQLNKEFKKIYCTNSYRYTGLSVEIADVLTNLTMFEL